MSRIIAALTGLLLFLTPSAIAQDDVSDDETYDQQTVIGEASDFLGDTTEGLAKIIEKIFAENGRPNAYIKGTEAGGGFIVGLVYGSGTLTHKIEGDRLVHWTGPSIGFDVGGNASKVFTLVYNLYDTEDIYRRYPAIEGSFYFIGGVGVNYQRRGEITVAPIRLGGGLRAQAALGYTHFTKKRKFVPF